MLPVTGVVVTPSGLTAHGLSVWVPGRPAPQGSKRIGEHGQMREASPYLPAWRQAVKRAVYERFRELGITPADVQAMRRNGTALFGGPVGITMSFALDPDRRVDAMPDLDKLQRAVWDELTKARVWEDDGRVISVSASKNMANPDTGTGVFLRVWQVIP